MATIIKRWKVNLFSNYFNGNQTVENMVRITVKHKRNDFSLLFVFFMIRKKNRFLLELKMMKCFHKYHFQMKYIDKKFLWELKDILRIDTPYLNDKDFLCAWINEEFFTENNVEWWLNYMKEHYFFRIEVDKSYIRRYGFRS